jgi:hypothetical protein
MAAESRASALQTCPACGASFETSVAEPLARVECSSCAVYANATGQPDAARQLAEAAAQAKPEYREQLSILLGP